jgi:hypothetical protein
LGCPYYFTVVVADFAKSPHIAVRLRVAAATATAGSCVPLSSSWSSSSSSSSTRVTQVPHGVAQVRRRPARSVAVDIAWPAVYDGGRRLLQQSSNVVVAAVAGLQKLLPSLLVGLQDLFRHFHGRPRLGPRSRVVLLLLLLLSSLLVMV